MNFLIIGSNFIVDKFLEAAVQAQGFCLHTTYSRSREQALRNQQKWGALSATDELLAAAKDPAIDCAYIASPNLCHFSQAKLLLEHGKHVLCEKPICLSAAELSALLAIARAKGVVLLEAMRPLFLPHLPQIRAQLAALGRIRYAEFCYCQYSSRYDRFQQGIVENAFKKELGNGALRDIGIYCLSVMEYLLGSPLSMHYAQRELPQSIDVTGLVTARYAEFDAVCRFSKVHDSHRGAIIEGEQGTLELLGFPICKGFALRLRHQQERQHAFAMYDNDMRYEIEAFLQMCCGEADAESYQQHSLACMGMLDTLKSL